MTDIDSASQDSLELLRQRMEAAHTAYSESFHGREPHSRQPPHAERR